VFGSLLFLVLVSIFLPALVSHCLPPVIFSPEGRVTNLKHEKIISGREHTYKEEIGEIVR
jgi:hypothetical protein